MRRVLAGVVAALAIGSNASADILPAPGGLGGVSSRLFDTEGVYYFDSGITTNGLTYRFDFYIESADPNATFYHSGPTQKDYYVDFLVAPGFIQSQSSPEAYAQYRWEQVASPKGVVSYLLRTPKETLSGMDYCGDPAYVGKVCRENFGTFFNGGAVVIDSDAPVFVTEKMSIVPEPSTWALMLTGFALAGAAVRGRVRTLIV